MKYDKKIALDTNIFIYHFDKNLHFLPITQKLFEDLETNKFSAITSVVSLVEILSYKMSSEKIVLLKAELLTTPGLTIYEVTQTIATEAARIRREYGFRLPDAIQLATAVYAKADMFVTNDERLKKCKEIKIQLLK